MANALATIAMWVAIGVGFVSLGQCFRAEQTEDRRTKQVSACQKIHEPQAQADCIKGVGR